MVLGVVVVVLLGLALGGCSAATEGKVGQQAPSTASDSAGDAGLAGRAAHTMTAFGQR
jgi:hypothetical protein